MRCVILKSIALSVINQKGGERYGNSRGKKDISSRA